MNFDFTTYFHSMFSGIRERSGTTAKVEYFGECLKSASNLGVRDHLEEWLHLLYAGDVTFGVVKFSFKGEFLGGNNSIEMFQLLKKLASRELTGGAAKSAIDEVLHLGPKCGEEVLQWFLKKDPKAGFGPTSANKVLNKPVFIWTNQKPNSVLSKDKENGDFNDWTLIPRSTRCLVEYKYDGNRLYIVKKPGTPIEALTAFGHVVPSLVNFLAALETAAAAAGIHDFVLDGEFFKKDRSYTNSILRSHTPCGVGDIDFYAFAHMSFDVWKKTFSQPSGMTNRELYHSVGKFLEIVKFDGVKSVVSEDLSEYVSDWDTCLLRINKKMEEAVQAGFEGIVIKDLDAIYDRGRNDDNRSGWWKAKFLDWYDARIIDIEEGEGKFSGMLGAFVVDYNGVVNRISLSLDGSLTIKNRIDYWNQRFTLTDRVMRIQSYGLTKDGSFIHGKFAGLHPEKI